jgi:enoyl-CoA hydratase/carnithine racemase
VKGLARAKAERVRTGLAGATDDALAFFTQEYFTDYFLHVFKKPVVAWLDGICMGGGVGLTQGASHRVVTERTTMAMPEVFIGFFADVGGSKFLAAVPGGLGLYFGMTGRKFSGVTARDMCLVDYVLPSSAKRQVFADLARLDWVGRPEADCEMATEYLRGFGQEHNLATPSELPRWFEKVFARGDFAEIVQVLEEDRVRNEPESRRPSLLSQAVFYRLCQMNGSRGWSEVFVQEWATALHFSTATDGQNGLGEFGEGVRALLIDKEPFAKWPERTVTQAWDEAARYVAPFEPNLLRARLASSGP